VLRTTREHAGCEIVARLKSRQEDMTESGGRRGSQVNLDGRAAYQNGGVGASRVIGRANAGGILWAGGKWEPEVHSKARAAIRGGSDEQR